MTEWYEKSPALAGLFEWNAVHSDVVRVTGLEPARLLPPEPKSGASANSATPACADYYIINPTENQAKNSLHIGLL